MNDKNTRKFRENIEELLSYENGKLRVLCIANAVQRSLVSDVTAQEIKDYVEILANIQIAIRMTSPTKKEYSDLEEELELAEFNKDCDQNCDCDCDKQAPLAEDGQPETVFAAPPVFTTEYDDGQH